MDIKEVHHTAPKKVVTFRRNKIRNEMKADQMKIDFSGTGIVDDLTDRAKQNVCPSSRNWLIFASLFAFVLAFGAFSLMFSAQAMITETIGSIPPEVDPAEYAQYGQTSAIAFFGACFSAVLGLMMISVGLITRLQR